MLVVEQYGVEVLARLVRQPFAEVGEDVAGPSDRFTGSELALTVPLGDLDRCQDLGEVTSFFACGEPTVDGETWPRLF